MVEQILGEVAGDRRAEQVQQMLADLARQLGPNSKLPTTRDLRKKMRVSQATLDSALDGMELQGIIQRRHGSGVYVSPLIRLKRIAVVLAHGVLEARFDTFDHILLRALRPEARRRNALVTYHFADPEHNEDEHGPHQLAIDAQQGRIDAMVIRGPLSRHIPELQSIAIPRVFVTSAKSATPRIEFESTSVISRGVELLARAGRRRIGFVYADFGQVGDYVSPVQHFREALSALGLPFNEQWLIPFSADSVANRPLESSTQFHNLWQDWKDRPDAILSGDDQFTSGVVHACQLLRLNIPEQLTIVTHANKGLEIFGHAKVTRMEFDPAETARAIMDTIDESILPGQKVTEVRTICPTIVTPEERALMTAKPVMVMGAAATGTAKRTLVSAREDDGNGSGNATGTAVASPPVSKSGVRATKISPRRS